MDDIYIYIHICCGVIIWSKFGPLRGYYLVQVCLFLTVYVKNTRAIGVSTHFCSKQKVARKKIQGLSSGPNWPLLRRTKLGPENNPYLDQIITPQMYFLLFFASEHVLKCLFYNDFEHQPNFSQNLSKKTITFHILQTQVIKTFFVATLLLTKNWCFDLSFFERKH